MNVRIAAIAMLASSVVSCGEAALAECASSSAHSKAAVSAGGMAHAIEKQARPGRPGSTGVAGVFIVDSSCVAGSLRPAFF